MRSKIKSLAATVAAAERAGRAGKKIVTTNGAFDLLHIGHVRNLIKAKSLGDVLIVGVNSDASVRTHKDKSRPIMPERERAEVVAALGVVDHVFIFRTPYALPWLVKIKPHIHVKGADRAMKEIVEVATMKKLGGKIVRVPYVKNHSTSAIIEKIKKLSKS